MTTPLSVATDAPNSLTFLSIVHFYFERVAERLADPETTNAIEEAIHEMVQSCAEAVLDTTDPQKTPEARVCGQVRDGLISLADIVGLSHNEPMVQTMLAHIVPEHY